MARLALVDLLELGPLDILRLAMLLALRRGDIEAAAGHARRLAPLWRPCLADPGARLVARLVRELEAASPG